MTAAGRHRYNAPMPRPGLSYWSVLAQLTDRFANDIEIHAYFDDVDDVEQRRREGLVAALRLSRDLAQTIDAEGEAPAAVNERTLRLVPRGGV